MGVLKRTAKTNKEVVNSLSDELGIPDEKIPILVEKMLQNNKARDTLFRALGEFFGRRSFLEALVAGGAIATGLVSARTIITDKNIQITDPDTGIEWYLRTPLPFSALVGMEDGKVKAYDWKGNLIARGKAGEEDASVIQALDGIADPLKVVIMADIVAKQPVVFEKSKYVDINFLGHTVLNEAGGDYATFINYRVNNGVFIIRNVTVDNQDTVGDGITAGLTDVYPKKVIVENVEVKKFTNHALYFRLADPTEAVDENAEHDLILKNVRAEATSEGSLNECLTVDNARKVVIEEAELIGNKIAYIVASQTIAKKNQICFISLGVYIKIKTDIL